MGWFQRAQGTTQGKKEKSQRKGKRQSKSESKTNRLKKKRVLKNKGLTKLLQRERGEGEKEVAGTKISVEKGFSREH